MEKKYFYFQPQYVSRFKCDGSKCDAHCCKEEWNIAVDEDTRKQYERLGAAVTAHLKFHDDKGQYLLDFGGEKYCPFLNEKKLCRLQLKHGESFLSRTCATYPRITNLFGYFLERSLILSCPVVAEMILFEDAPMTFEFVEVPEEIHSHGGKIFLQRTESTEELRAHIIEIQAAMISILQERTLTLDQRLIVLGFFVDRLGEIFSDFDADALTKLIAAYESKKFLAEQVPRMLRAVTFDAEKFFGLMRRLMDEVFGADTMLKNKKFLDTVIVDAPLISEKKFFVAERAGFFENYLVNELFLNIYPWKFEDGNIAQNFSAFVTEYKFFELITFSAARKGFGSRKDLIEVTNWFTTRFDHTKELKRKIFTLVKDAEPFELMNSLLEGSD
ncbi:MAG: flagellin lysine-N-methylase [Selenomonadaceae bacterium]|nr:flagellin lysine-N-methylase [Selenomonadaceae bacterium]